MDKCTHEVCKHIHVTMALTRGYKGDEKFS